jgi:RNA polymerase sigma-70 factor (ECF subfamily)
VKPGSAFADYADFGEEILVDRARTGDMMACEALMRRYNRRLYRVIRSVLRTGSDVEDTMQDTYVAVLRNLDQLKGRAQFGTWLLKIGTNAALARLRQRMRVVQLDDLPDLDDREPLDLAAEATRSPEQQVSNSEIAAIVEEAIDRLPYDYRQVFMLRTIEGLDTTETAEVLGLGEDAVRQRFHRAREMLQVDIHDHVGSNAIGTAFGFLGRRCNRVVAAVLRRLSENPANN